MGKKKTTRTSDTTQTRTVHDTPDIQNYRAAVNQGVDLTTPITHSYGRAEDAINNQIFEQDLPEGVKERVRLSQIFNLNQDRGAALAAAKQQEHMARTGNLGALAGMTAGTTQTGHGTETTVEPFNWGGLAQGMIQGGASIGGAALM